MAEYEEQFKVKGDELLKKVKQLVAEGNIRRITIKGKDGKTYYRIAAHAGRGGGCAGADACCGRCDSRPHYRVHDYCRT